VTTTLDQSQADLPRLVELASQGEDVVITVDGKPTAKLTRLEAQAPEPFDGQRWIRELEELNRRYNPGSGTLTSEQILAEDREDRF
jgi:antitoxin (DNA-binding transcriptional repressor) of toxin-antitoxin stability system